MYFVQYIQMRFFLSFPEVFIETGLEFLSNTNLYFQICEIFK